MTPLNSRIDPNIPTTPSPTQRVHNALLKCTVGASYDVVSTGGHVCKNHQRCIHLQAGTQTPQLYYEV